ncbi:hypothetical protein HT95_002350 [Salmonella enterica subsp. enterica serovar Ago]|uniref:hypothetical protein n=1 Tax=Salmonella enterica TaxID=28901 RepID=UPI0013814556|nr:hypothetical protein [Salmonella enterica subsp. enterica serovar Ago]EDT2656092.1 hypothetical protein [Salmonella enterica subsp. enterica serovar Ago]EDW4428705.1 hypothetical protein [Salmonella enterica subsp. enterica serovar Ago]
MTTNFIYDTKSIMSRAWVLAREYRAKWAEKETRHSKWRKLNMNLRECFKCGLRNAWEEAKKSMTAARSNTSTFTQVRPNRGVRYLELLSIAERDGLSHGKSWYCGEREIETMGMNPMHEGELVCYVYAN